MSIIVVFGDGVGNRLEKHRFTGFRRRDDQAALTAPDGGHQVDDTTRNVRGHCFQVEHFTWENWCQYIKMWTAFGDFGVYSINGFDTQQAIILFIILRWANLAGNHVTCAQAKAADL